MEEQEIKGMSVTDFRRLSKVPVDGFAFRIGNGQLRALCNRAKFFERETQDLLESISRHVSPSQFRIIAREILESRKTRGVELQTIPEELASKLTKEDLSV